MNNPIAWINGRFLPFSAAAVPVWDLGVVAGASVTEMARTYRHIPFRIDQHLTRLLESCNSLGFPMPYEKSELRSAVDQVVQENSQLIRSESDLGVVVFVTAGSNATYLSGAMPQGTVCVHTFELPFALWKAGLIHGVRLRIPSVRQLPEECLDIAHKVRNRLHWWLADHQAARLESGARALLLSQSGCITETSTGCFYAVVNGAIVTPDCLVLNSMSRRLVEELANEHGIRFERRSISVQEIGQFEEAFLSSTPSCLMPVSHIDGQRIGDGRVGRYVVALRRAWSQHVGVDILAQARAV